MTTSKPPDALRLDRETQLDLLFDLLHDLGKYIRMPISLLPENASPQQVREGVEQALTRTRSGPREARGARAIWEMFVSESGGSLSSCSGWESLLTSVEDVLVWEDRLRREALIDRDAVMADFNRVPEAIRALIVEIRGEAE